MMDYSCANCANYATCESRDTCEFCSEWRSTIRDRVDKNPEGWEPEDSD